MNEALIAFLESRADDYTNHQAFLSANLGNTLLTHPSDDRPIESEGITVFEYIASGWRKEPIIYAASLLSVDDICTLLTRKGCRLLIALSIRHPEICTNIFQRICSANTETVMASLHTLQQSNAIAYLVENLPESYMLQWLVSLTPECRSVLVNEDGQALYYLRLSAVNQKPLAARFFLSVVMNHYAVDGILPQLKADINAGFHYQILTTLALMKANQQHAKDPSAQSVSEQVDKLFTFAWEHFSKDAIEAIPGNKLQTMVKRLLQANATAQIAELPLHLSSNAETFKAAIRMAYAEAITVSNPVNEELTHCIFQMFLSALEQIDNTALASLPDPDIGSILLILTRLGSLSALNKLIPTLGEERVCGCLNASIPPTYLFYLLSQHKDRAFMDAIIPRISRPYTQGMVCNKNVLFTLLYKLAVAGNSTVFEEVIQLGESHSYPITMTIAPIDPLYSVFLLEFLKHYNFDYVDRLQALDAAPSAILDRIKSLQYLNIILSDNSGEVAKYLEANCPGKLSRDIDTQSSTCFVFAARQGNFHAIEEAFKYLLPPAKIQLLSQDNYKLLDACLRPDGMRLLNQSVAVLPEYIVGRWLCADGGCRVTYLRDHAQELFADYLNKPAVQAVLRDNAQSATPPLPQPGFFYYEAGETDYPTPSSIGSGDLTNQVGADPYGEDPDSPAGQAAGPEGSGW